MTVQDKANIGDDFTLINDSFSELANNLAGLSTDSLNEDTRTLIDNTLSSLYNYQADNLKFLNDFNSFAIQNTVNQELTNLFTDNQNEQVQALNEKIEKENQNKLRLTEINRYYKQRNQTVIDIIRDLLIFFVVLLIFILLGKYGILPPGVSRFFTFLTLASAIVFAFFKFYDMSRRSPINFDEYVIPFDETAKLKEQSGALTDITKVFKTEFSDAIKGSSGLESVLGCVGESCCAPGTIYDISLDMCVEKCPSPYKYYNYSENPGCYKDDGKTPLNCPSPYKYYNDSENPGCYKEDGKTPFKISI